MGSQHLRQLGLFTLLLLTNTTLIKADEFGDEVNKTVECIKYIIQNGIKVLGIDGFAQIKVDDFRATVEDVMFEGVYEFKNSSIKGLDGFTLEEFEVKQGQIDYSFMLHGLSFEGLYDFDARMIDLADLIGNGEFNFQVGMRLKGNISYDSQPWGIDIENVEVIPTAFPQMMIKGLSVGVYMSELISKHLDAIVIEVINNEDTGALINDILGNALKTLLNLLLGLGDEVIEAILGLLATQCPNINQEHLSRVEL